MAAVARLRVVDSIGQGSPATLPAGSSVGSFQEVTNETMERLGG